jgi:hypothetical protein
MKISRQSAKPALYPLDGTKGHQGREEQAGRRDGNFEEESGRRITASDGRQYTLEGFESAVGVY